VDDLAALIQRELDQRNWTLSDLSRYSGLSLGLISMWRSGKQGKSQGPRPESLQKLARALNLPYYKVCAATGRFIPDPPSESEEAEIIHAYRELTPGDRHVVRVVLRALRERHTTLNSTEGAGR